MGSMAVTVEHALQSSGGAAKFAFLGLFLVLSTVGITLVAKRALDKELKKTELPMAARPQTAAEDVVEISTSETL